jgi:adenosylcobyric acid synthase
MAKVIMIQGTTSNAGKSLITAGLCRIFLQDGYTVAPFKSQNMALNSYITPEGLEMGRAQAVQAEAAGTTPSVLMNPILLKPTNDVGSQIIVCGKSQGNMMATDYFKYRGQLRDVILEAYNSLADEYEIIVIEGAGSPAEINLKRDDIVNMGMAEMVDAPVLMVADIDRGGVFASLYGTMELLEPHERARVKGQIINKFRGQLEILTPGLAQLEELTNIPVLGVVPYVNHDIDEEDSLSEKLTRHGKVGLIDIAVIRLPRMTDFTDFSPLERFEEISLRYVQSVRDLGEPDLIFLPGTKDVLGDLKWLSESGFKPAITRYAEKGGAIIAISGGYQMLGTKIAASEGIEGGEMDGLGLFPFKTTYMNEIVSSQCQGAFKTAQGIFASMNGIPFDGYENHTGGVLMTAEASPLCEIKTSTGEAKADGLALGNILGCHIHGIFANQDCATALVDALRAAKGLAPGEAAVDWSDYKNQQYNNLAAALRESLNMEEIYSILGLPGPKKGEE